MITPEAPARDAYSPVKLGYPVRLPRCAKDPSKSPLNHNDDDNGRTSAALRLENPISERFKTALSGATQRVTMTCCPSS
jgi:hypothetical protein